MSKNGRVASLVGIPVFLDGGMPDGEIVLRSFCKKNRLHIVQASSSEIYDARYSANKWCWEQPLLWRCSYTTLKVLIRGIELLEQGQEDYVPWAKKAMEYQHKNS